MLREGLSACFLGPCSENDHLLERLLLDFVRDHGFWRRNFHPADRPAISTADQKRDGHTDMIDRMREELSALSAELKKAVPFFSPRYVGHMSSDILLPAFIARVITTLYNPNNVSEEASPVTLEKELQVGLQLARMFGMRTDETTEPCAWGHLTSGGTVANYEALWNFRALAFWPLALAAAARATGVEIPALGPLGRPLLDHDDYELMNLGIDAVVALRRATATALRASLDPDRLRAFARELKARRIEALGTADFFREHDELEPPLVLVPASGHYSWEKGMKVLGFGTRQLVKIGVDSNMRMDVVQLAERLEQARRERRPVLAVVGVLGTTEFGTIDPIDRLVALRRSCRAEGQDFGIHVDGAWGGYLASIFRRPDGDMEPREKVARRFRYFPSPAVHGAFAALPEVDSITVDPHKLGYVPYAAGAFVCRNREVIDFIAQEASYVFDVEDSRRARGTGEKLRNLGKYVLEGSKAGAAAASVYVTHKVLPLDDEGFGLLLEETIRATEYLHELVMRRREALADRFRITIPFVTDSNLICFAVNPRGNRDLAVMNRFARRVFESLRVDPSRPIQVKEFIGSYTSLARDNVPAREADRILEELGIDPASFVAEVRDPAREADHIFLLRHTLMNPWLMKEDGGRNWLDRYWDYLETLLDAAAVERPV